MYWCGQIMIFGGIILFHLRMRREKEFQVAGRRLSVSHSTNSELKLAEQLTTDN
jgi:hypothetical protein